MHVTTTLPLMARPDHVLVNSKEIYFPELTIPFNSPESLVKTCKRKNEKSNYQLFLSEMDDRGIVSSLMIWSF